METPTPINQNTEPKIPQETIVTLQFPDILKSTFRMYLIILSLLTVVVIFLGSNDPELLAIGGLAIFTVIGSIITGAIGVVKCLRCKGTLTLGQKIVGWTVSLVTLTAVIPLIVIMGLFILLMYVGHLLQ